MINWILSQIQTFATLGFCFGVIAILALLFIAWRYHVAWGYKYAGALVLPVIFFLLFSVFVGSVRLFAWWIAAATFWGSLLLAVVTAVIGFTRRNPGALFASAIIAIPFAFYLFLSPGTRAAIVVPILLLGCAIAMRWYQRRTNQNVVPYKFR